MSTTSDIKSGRLPEAAYKTGFCDKKPPLNLTTAAIESSRCYFCYDAPCIQACPTEINIPSFIRKIHTENLKGAAADILGQNIMGATCARVCPVETLCEEACVRNTNEDKPVTIGELQRFATDWLFENKIQPFKRAKSTGKKVAVVGAGPAGLSCAHRLAMLGHDVVVYEAKEKSGGLNEYGLAAYKVVDESVQKEIDFILSIGGIKIKNNHRLGKEISLSVLRKDYSAVFLGAGLSGVNSLKIPGEDLPNVIDAVEYIAKLRQSPLNKLPVGRRVIVVGGGNTAIDIAVQTKLLGATDVTMIYRRGPKEMGATWKEQELAKKNGVVIKYWTKPVKISTTSVELESTQNPSEKFTLEYDMIFKAIGQALKPEDLGDAPEFLKIDKGRIIVDENKRTSLPNVFAGGDCVNGGALTVTAVQDGKIAALNIHKMLSGKSLMADLRCNMAGIKSPNPFWLASAPPTDKAYNVVRAFEAGWGGVVWKTLGEDPPVVNVSSRYGAMDYGGQKIIGFNNIELITDRPLDVNLKEITQVKKDWPDRAIIVSLMVPCEEEAWKTILKKVEATGADGVELNFGCPHGMSERGMGSAVGQVPEYIKQVTEWCKKHTKMPVLVKLTPNITDVRYPARAAKAGGADGVSLINTINSITSVDLDVMAPRPTVDGKGTHGGYCGPAVKPIALNMVAEIARDPETAGIPISGIGGISTWRDAAEFFVLGAQSVQVCTAAMHYGFKIVDDMIDGLNNWMDSKGYKTLDDIVGKAIPNVTTWQNLNINYETVAKIDQDKCIKCGLCFIACEDTSHQAISASKNAGVRKYEVIDDECVGCNLCMLACPVPSCITMVKVENGKPYMNWTQDPRNPRAVTK